MSNVICTRRLSSDYPAKITPEHDKRLGGHDCNFDETDHLPLHPDINAAYDYVTSVLNTSDFTNPIAWHGWAIREAFLAGISHAQKNSIAISQEQLDQHLDKILKASGSALKNYTMAKSLDEMRSALSAAINGAVNE